MTTLLVFGWYGKGNIGDELMKRALTRLFNARNVDLRFVDHIDLGDLLTSQGIIFGGGSILHDAPDVTPRALDVILKTVPVFYLGVGLESPPHQIHADLLRVARLVIKRSDVGHGEFAYDLVYSLPFIDDPQPRQGIVIVPNIELLPTNQSSNWAQLAWLRYVDEMSQVLDYFDKAGESISFLPMCKNDRQDDAWAISSMVSHMTRRSTKFKTHHIGPRAQEIINLFQRSKCIVTQRYHGIVLAEMAGTSYVSIDHHDKLSQALPRRGQHLSYHGVTKSTIIAAIEKAMLTHFSPFVPDMSMYHLVVGRVIEALNER